MKRNIGSKDLLLKLWRRLEASWAIKTGELRTSPGRQLLSNHDHDSILSQIRRNFHPTPFAEKPSALHYPSDYERQ